MLRIQWSRLVNLTVLAAALSVVSGAASVAAPISRHVLQLHAGQIDLLLDSHPGREQPTTPDRPGYWIVQLYRPANRSVLANLNLQFGPALLYLPQDAYVFYLHPPAVGRATRLDWVRAVAPFHPSYKISPNLKANARGAITSSSGPRQPLIVHLFPNASPQPVLTAIQDLGGSVIGARLHAHPPHIQAVLPPHTPEALALVEQVSWIEPVPNLTQRNETTRWVLQSNQPKLETIWDHGLSGQAQTLGHIDGPLDLDHCLLSDTVVPGPDHRKVVGYRIKDGASVDGHGTHTAATAAGSQAGEELTGAGIAPQARLSHTDLALVNGFGQDASNLEELLFLAHQDGARIHTNSWGDDDATHYTSLARDIDQFSWENEDDLVVFAATNLSSLRYFRRTPRMSLPSGPRTRRPPKTSTAPEAPAPLRMEGANQKYLRQVARSPRPAPAVSARWKTEVEPPWPPPRWLGPVRWCGQYFTEGWYPSGEKRNRSLL